MTDFNPYKPPKTSTTEFLEFNSQGIRRYGKNVLFVPVGTDLPPRCIYCNQPATDKKIKQTYYHDRIYPIPLMIILAIILIVFSLSQFIVFLIVFIIIANTLTQRKANSYVHLCTKHWQKYISFRFCCFSIFIMSFFAIFLIAKSSIEKIWILFSIFTMLICLLIMNFAYRLPKSIKIDETGCYLKGFGKEFLQSFQQKSSD